VAATNILEGEVTLDTARAEPELTESRFLASRWQMWLVRIALLTLLLGLWQFLAGDPKTGFALVDKFWVSQPGDIAARIGGWISNGSLWFHLAITLQEMAAGFVIGSLAGIFSGVVLGRNQLIATTLDPFIMGFNSIPKLALAPLFILWFGIGIWSKVTVVILLVLFPVTINTEAGLRVTSERLIEMLRSFGASRRQIFIKVSLPSAMPFILAGLKLGIGRGLIAVVVAELFGSRAGLGNLISQSADSFNMPDLFAGVIILAVAGIAMTAGFSWLETRLVPWTKD